MTRPNVLYSPSKDAVLAAGWASRPVEAEQLFDLARDPQERRNLATDPFDGAQGRECVERPAHAAVLAEMRARLDRWMRATNDPLLAGPVPAPPGAVVNSPDSLSPKERPRSAG
jgi:N-sulfoglucosamine sulfohydrolase